MYGDTIWAIGIETHYDGDGWRARVNFQDYGHCDRGSIHGHIQTKYTETSLSFAIDTIKRDAERMGVEFIRMDEIRTPSIYYLNDAEHGCATPPSNWRELLLEQARRIGWYCYRMIEPSDDSTDEVNKCPKSTTTPSENYTPRACTLKTR